MKPVLDASAVLKLFMPEDEGEKVLKLIYEDILVPSLLPYEVGNALWKTVARGELKKEEAERAWELFKKLLKRWKVVEVDCLGTSLRCGITCYDAAYVALVRTPSWSLSTHA